MPAKRKTVLWVLAVYALSFLCYVPLLLRQSGAMVPGVLLYAGYLFVLIPVLVSLMFLAGEGPAGPAASKNFPQKKPFYAPSLR